MTNAGHLAIIPARSGSKGLPDKNIKLLAGKPLLVHTVEAALESGVFDEVFVSTDSARYAEIARAAGAQLPFLRSEALATDTATTTDVILEALDRYREAGRDFKYFTVLQPTSPLRRAGHIREAWDLLREKHADAIVSVCEVDHSPLWCSTLPESGSLDGFLPFSLPANRQALGKYYRINGAIYTASAELFRLHQSFYRANCFAYLMNRRDSVDIDDQLDFNFAEFLIERPE